MDIVKMVMARMGTLIGGVNAGIQPADDATTQVMVVAGLVLGIIVDVVVEKRREKRG
nr:MAG: hypothetical protein [Microvirus sp.]